MIMQSTGARRYRVLIIDDRTLVRAGLRQILDREADIAICGEALEGDDAVDLAKSFHPDIIFLNPTTPGFEGLDATRRIREASPETDIHILSFQDGHGLAKSLDVGEIGDRATSESTTLIAEAFQRLRQRQILPTDRSKGVLLGLEIRGLPHDKSKQDPCLTIRQTEIVRFLADGRTNRETATLLGVSMRTIESHRNRIMHKMHLTSYSALIRFAIRNGLIDG